MSLQQVSATVVSNRIAVGQKSTQNQVPENRSPTQEAWHTYRLKRVFLLLDINRCNELAHHGTHGGVQPCPDNHCQHLILRIVRIPNLHRSHVRHVLHFTHIQVTDHVFSAFYTSAGQYHAASTFHTYTGHRSCIFCILHLCRSIPCSFCIPHLYRSHIVLWQINL